MEGWDRSWTVGEWDSFWAVKECGSLTLRLFRSGTGLGLLRCWTCFGLVLRSVAVLLLGCLGVGQVLGC